MFVLNANTCQDTSQYVSTVKYGLTPGFYNFFVGGYGYSCYSTPLDIQCLNSCRRCCIGTFQFNNYDRPVYADTYRQGVRSGCSRGSGDPSGMFYCTCLTATTYCAFYAEVSSRAFEGGEVIGKNVLTNRNYVMAGGNIYCSGSYACACVGLVHTDGSLEYLISSCCGEIYGNNNTSYFIPGIDNGPGIIACQGDRIFIGFCAHIVGDTAARCKIFMFGGVRPTFECYIGTGNGLSTALRGFLGTPNTSERALPIQISID